MDPHTELLIRPFEPRDQDAARLLILDGLRDHFGVLDPTYNRDLDDIAATYGGGLFLVAEVLGDLAGTGVITPETDGHDGDARIQRMSTARAHRRRGIATALLDALIAHARAGGHTRVVLGTNTGWEDAIGLYRAYGFEIESADAYGVRFAMPIAAARASARRM